MTGAGRNAVFIHPDDASRLGFAGGDPIRLVVSLGSPSSGVVFPARCARESQVHWPGECVDLIGSCGSGTQGSGLQMVVRD